MDVFEGFLTRIDDPEQRKRTEEVLGWVMEQFPDLTPVIKWNQPMFTNRDTYIIGFSAAKKHLAVAPEAAGIQHFSEEIKQAGYEHTQQLARFTWDSPFDYDLLRKMIEFNMWDKADYSTFWRK